MDLDPTWLLWGLPLVFALGWWASRFDRHQWRLESRQAPRAYFRGLNHLLNEQQDEAIDAFIEAVQSDPDTSELHFALGNLFRRRGDYDRAVRVHEHLLARGDLSARDRQRAMYALAQDFLRAGLLDRAEAALLRLRDTPFEDQADLALLSIFERARDWPQAREAAARIEATQPGVFRARQAHHWCEQAEACDSAEAARPLLEQAIRLAPEAPRAHVALARLQREGAEPEAALSTLERMVSVQPSMLPLVAQDLSALAIELQRQPRVRTLLTEWQTQHAPAVDVTEALARLQQDDASVPAVYQHHLEAEPSLVVAGWWLERRVAKDEWPDADKLLPAVRQASAPLRRYRCAACGFEAQRHFWHCPGCQAWDSFPPRRVEEL